MHHATSFGDNVGHFNWSLCLPCTRKVSAVIDLCHSHHRSLRFFVLLALLYLCFPQYVVALSSGEIIAISSMRDSWPQLGMTYPEWNGDPSTACNPVWYGITCDASENIVQFALPGSGLVGTIPPELGNLASLQYLYLYDNQLNGTIPPELGNLASLKQLHLYVNQLSGTIPPELVNLASLQQLNLLYNQLSGTIPPELANMASLQRLYLYNNQLSGTIPPELGNMASLQYLYLYNNKLYGAFPMELLHLPSLNFLDVSSNDLSLCPPTNSTIFTPSSSLSSCILTNQRQACGDSQCSDFYSSLPCSVNFGVCPTIPVTPVAPPVTDAPDTPAASPVPPPDPPFSCPSQTPPGPSFSCIDGVWTSVGNVSGVSIQISSPTSIEGDLDLSNTLTFVGIDGSLSVDGCVNIEGIEIVLSDEDVERIKKSSSGKQSLELLKKGKTTGCATLDSIHVSVKNPKSCTKASASRDPSSTHSSLAVLFKVDSTNCHLWWIILISVLGGIVVITLVIVLLVTFHNRNKAKRARSTF